MTVLRPGRFVRSLGRVGATAVVFHAFTLALCAQNEPSTSLRIEIVEATAGALDDGVVPYTLPVASPAPACVPIQADIVLESRVEPCFSEPALCDRTENFITQDAIGVPTGFGCSDGLDNDNDGLTDADDPDCIGVQGWSFSVRTDDCFFLDSISLEGTVADLLLSPPGRRDFQSFEKSEVVVPGFNGGQAGVVAACGLSLSNPVFLEVGAHTVLKLNGRLETESLSEVGTSTAPCGLSIVPPGQIGLVGSGEPLVTAVTVAGETVLPNVSDATVRARLSADVVFLRGDADSDGRTVLGDSVYVLNHLFLGGPPPSCADAADIDDNGILRITDAVLLLNYLFLSGEAPPAPGPMTCGQDPTPDALGCDAMNACPTAEPAFCDAPPPGSERTFCERRFLDGTGNGGVALADFDLDGELDAATGAPRDGIAVFLGEGDGSLALAQELGATEIPSSESLLATDLDADGVPDLVAVGETGLVFFLSGAPGRLLPSRSVSGLPFDSVASGDLDGDAIEDLIAVSTRGDAHVFLGIDGSQFADAVLHRVGGGESSIAVGDFDGDNALDFVTTVKSELAGQCAVFHNQGTGAFDRLGSLPVGTWCRGASVGDLDGDGRLDIVAAHVGQGRQDWVSAFLGTAEAFNHLPLNLNPDRSGGCGGCGGARATALADFDGDGVLDFAVDTVFNDLLLLHGNRDGTFDVGSQIPARLTRLTAGDIDGDGDPDLAGSHRGPIAVYTNCTTP